MTTKADIHIHCDRHTEVDVQFADIRGESADHIRIRIGGLPADLTIILPYDVADDLLHQIKAHMVDEIPLATQ